MDEGFLLKHPSQKKAIKHDLLLLEKKSGPYVIAVSVEVQIGQDFMPSANALRRSHNKIDIKIDNLLKGSEVLQNLKFILCIASHEQWDLRKLDLDEYYQNHLDSMRIATTNNHRILGMYISIPLKVNSNWAEERDIIPPINVSRTIYYRFTHNNDSNVETIQHKDKYILSELRRHLFYQGIEY